MVRDKLHYRGLATLRAAVMLLTVYAVSAEGVAEQVSLTVDADWLKQNLADKNVVVVDTRDREMYLAGHVSGAVNIPVELTFSPREPKDRVANITHIQKLFGDAGIDNHSQVVLYDHGEYINAGRVFWVLEVYGHKYVKLLNGGFKGWVNKQYPISSEQTVVKPRQFIATIQPQHLATRLHTLLAIDDDSKFILDARPEDEYTGKFSQSARAGHIPSAINIPWDRNLHDVDGVPTIKSIEELKQVYKDIDPAKKTITYCNKGKQSSFSYFILRQLGHDVSHYDGSWFEWGNDAKLPIEK